MSEGATEPRKASAWPVFVAVGLAVAEIGVFLDGLYPLAVAGLLLFVGSVAGIVSEAGYVDRPWRLLGGLGYIFELVEEQEGPRLVVHGLGMDRFRPASNQECDGNEKSERILKETHHQFR